MREGKFSRLAKGSEGKSVARYITGNAKSRWVVNMHFSGFYEVCAALVSGF